MSMDRVPPALIAQTDQRIAHGHDVLRISVTQFNELRAAGCGDTEAVARILKVFLGMSKMGAVELLAIAVLELADRQGDGNV